MTEKTNYNAQSTQAEKLRQFTIRMPDKMHLDLKMRAVQDGTSMGAIIEQLVTEYLNKKK